MNRRTFLRNGLGAAAFVGCGTVAYGAGYERHDFQIVNVPLQLGLPSPLRAAVLADIHFDPLYETGYLGAVFQAVAAQSPDLLLLAGDYATHTAVRFKEFGQIAGRIKPPLGSFASLGNHDHLVGWTTVRDVLEENGITVLRNAAVPLPGNPGWALAGMDSFLEGQPDNAFLARASAQTQFIALVHEPDAWDFLPDPRIRLQISGHTHGGQIRVPFFGAIARPSLGRKYDAGLFTHDGRLLYVNRGIGTIGIPCRIDCPPEITILELS